jgi:pimeloyl-ACP methyl ester carboxylesterase
MRRAPLVLTAVAGAAALARRRRTAPAGEWPAVEARESTVTADDGTTLHVAVSGPEEASGTVVLAHGYVLGSRLWDHQVAALAQARPDLRVVVYDQRGHGRSARAAKGSATIEQLGKDLRAVLDAEARGPVVLAGHSMGGMTIMSLVEQYPDEVGDRVVGAALVSTSGGGLAEVDWGLPPRIAARIRAGLPAGMEQARRWEDAGRKALPQPFLRPLLFGKGADPTAVRTALEVYTGNSAHTVADFFETFPEHDRIAALSALSEVPVTVLVGTKDRICPLEHSRALAEALPHARFRVYPGAGHMLQLERPADVSAELIALAEVLPTAATGPRSAASRAG